MLRKIEKNAKSVEEAVRLAADELGVDVSEVSYEVEREVGKGLMGLILGREVIISAWITAEEDAENKLHAEEQRRANEIKQRAEAREKKEQRRPVKNEQKPKADDKKNDTPDLSAYAPKREKKPEISEIKAVSEDASAAEKTEQKGNKQRKVTQKAIDDANVFVNELIRKMGIDDVTAVAEHGGDYVRVVLPGNSDSLHRLIGYRGRTLNAIQYLTNLYINKPKNSYIKVVVDTEGGYRQKRDNDLRTLARKLEKTAMREKKTIHLEPMPPAERRIIHASLQNSEVVTTYSVGDEPKRHIVVEHKK